MFCIEDFGAVFIHVLLILNIAYYALALKFTQSVFLSRWLRVNLVALFFLFLKSVTGASVLDFSEVWGIILFAIMMYAVIFTTLESMIVTCMVMVSSQIAILYFPDWANFHAGLPHRTGVSLALFAPFMSLIVMRMCAYSELFSSIFTTLVQSYILIISGKVLFKDRLDMENKLCCDPTGSCDLFLTITELFLFVLLVAFRLCFVLYRAVLKMQEERNDAKLLKEAKLDHHHKHNTCKVSIKPVTSSCRN